ATGDGSRSGNGILHRDRGSHRFGGGASVFFCIWCLVFSVWCETSNSYHVTHQTPNTKHQTPPDYFSPKQYSVPFCVPTSSRPAATAGDPVTGLSSSIFCSCRPLLRSITYRKPSSEPTYTRSPTTTGDASMRLPVTKFHFSSPVFLSSA